MQLKKYEKSTGEMHGYIKSLLQNLPCAVKPRGQPPLIFKDNTLPTVKHNLRAFRGRTIDGSVMRLQMSQPKLC